MINKELLLKRKETWHKYHVPGKGNYTTRPINAIFLSPANSLKHEMEKCRVCYALLSEKKKFITEASENRTGLRRDIVCLDNGEILEIETSEKRAERFKSDPMKDSIIIVPLWDK